MTRKRKRKRAQKKKIGKPKKPQMNKEDNTTTNWIKQNWITIAITSCVILCYLKLTMYHISRLDHLDHDGGPKKKVTAAQVVNDEAIESINAQWKSLLSSSEGPDDFEEFEEVIGKIPFSDEDKSVKLYATYSEIIRSAGYNWRHYNEDKKNKSVKMILNPIYADGRLQSAGPKFDFPLNQHEFIEISLQGECYQTEDGKICSAFLMARLSGSVGAFKIPLFQDLQQKDAKDVVFVKQLPDGLEEQ